jgi:uncharacterized membrane protein
MNGLLGLIRGWAGKPLHPPLTDVSVGAYAAAVAMLVLGTFGVEEEQMAHGALLAVGAGLAVAAPTALTGLLDWLTLERGTPARTTATVHLVVMSLTTALFVLTFISHLDGYDDGQVETLPLVLGLVGFALLGGGGYVGGTLVFVYGVRVLKREQIPMRDALIPGRAEPPEQPKPRSLFRRR